MLNHSIAGMSVKENQKFRVPAIRQKFLQLFYWLAKANHLSIRDKLSLGFGLLVVVTFLVVGRSYLASVQANKTIERTQESYVPAAIASSMAQKNLLRMLSNLRGYLATGRSDLRDRYQEARHNFEIEVAKLQTLLENSDSTSEKQHLQELQATYETWSDLPEQLFTLHENAENNQPAWELLQQQGKNRISNIRGHVNRTIELQKTKDLSNPEQANLLENLIKFRSSFAIAVSSLQGYVMTRRTDLRTNYIKHMKTSEQLWQNLQKRQRFLSDRQQEQFQNLSQSWNQFQNLPEKIFTIVESEEHRRDLFLLRTKAEPRAEKMLTLLNSIVDTQQTALTQELQEGRNALTAAHWQILLASMAALVFGGTMSLVLRRRIAGPIERLTDMTASIMKGNFQTRIDIETPDEIGKLAETFNSMSDSLAHSQAQLQEYNQTLESKVIARTKELQTKNAQLAQALQDLQDTQIQLIQAEKLSSLGQLVAGVAHEINNPINFIHGNIIHTRQYMQDLLELIELYRQEYPDANSEIEEFVEDIDLAYLQDDLPQVLSSMQNGTERIRDIVRSLRVFSRLDEAEIKDIDLHESIDSTVMVFQTRLRENLTGREIELVKDYGQLPLIRCYAVQINQVFANILNNAIDALEEKFSQLAISSGETANLEISEHPTIHIYTRQQNSQHATIGFIDNGIGIPHNICLRIFDPFFTTKAVGKGTGLGMSISYQIITKQHQGKLSCSSVPNQGTEFTIQLPVRLPSEKNV